MSAPIDIGPATLEEVRPGVVVVRFKEGSIAGAETFAVSMAARKTHFGDQPHVVVVVSPDDADFDPALLSKNQYRGQGVESFTKALAFVSRNPTITNILELYYALHPAPFPVKFFTEEKAALPWAEAQVGRSVAGGR
jgi:hypothetical protein